MTRVRWCIVEGRILHLTSWLLAKIVTSLMRFNEYITLASRQLAIALDMKLKQRKSP
jgi:hypothetical protein